MNFTTTVKNYISAGYSALYLTTHEEARLCAELVQTLKATHKIVEWDSINGLAEKLANEETRITKDTADPLLMFKFILTHCEAGNSQTIFILKDFHLQFDNPLKKINIIRAFKIAASILKATSNIILFVSPVVKIPLELTKDIQLVDYSLPTEEAIGESLDFIVDSINKGKKKEEKLPITPVIREAAIEAAKGMTDSEMENAFSLAIVTNKNFNTSFVKSVFTEKIQQVRKGGLLTYLDTNTTFGNVGGLDAIKTWMKMRSDGFSKQAREYGLPYPKGLGLAGIAGCGKTLISKAIANELGFPLFQLDLGKLFSKYVGETEHNFLEMIKTIESIGRCVIQLDEVEKYLNTGAVSGQGDSGTSSRSFGSILTWLSDRDSPAFIIATSNNHTILPPELIRKGRFDEWFWIDVPDLQERIEIFKVVIQKYKRVAADFEVSILAEKSVDYTGAEIDNVFKDAMFRAFSERKEVDQSHVLLEMSNLTPQAVIQADSIKLMREKVEGRLRLAAIKNITTTQKTRNVKV